MECPHCKKSIDIQKLWLKKPVWEKIREMTIYFANFKFLAAEPEEERIMNPADSILAFFVIFPGMFAIIGLGSFFITYPDYIASGHLNDLIWFPLFFICLGLILTIGILTFLYFCFRFDTADLFEKGYISVKCPSCQKEIQKVKTWVFRK